MKKLKNTPTVKAVRVYDSSVLDDNLTLIALFSSEGAAVDFVEEAAAVRFMRKAHGGNQSIEFFKSTFVIDAKPMSVRDSDITVWSTANAAARGALQTAPRTLSKRIKFFVRKAYYTIAA